MGNPRCSRMIRLALPSGRMARMRMRAAAGVADQDVGSEHALQKEGPVESTARGWTR